MNLLPNPPYPQIIIEKEEFEELKKYCRAMLLDKELELRIIYHRMFCFNRSGPIVSGKSVEEFKRNLIKYANSKK